MRPTTPTGFLLAGLLLLSGCGGEASPPRSGPTPSVSASPSASASSTPTPTAPPQPGTVAPTWLGKRVLPRTVNGYGEVRRTPPELRERRFTLPDRLPMLPGDGFAARVVRAPRSVLDRSTFRPSCPVAAADLDWVRLTFRGFDGQRHTGELLVNREVSDDLVAVFRSLYAAAYPIEEMRIPTKAEETAEPTGDGNNTAAYACRATTGASFFSQHAYGLAIDVNPFHNPYAKGEVVIPELASAYLDRSDVRPGMILRGGVVERAFDRIGWGWGGDYRQLKDFQHFSRNGR